jgi:hypothetical protein
MFLSKKEDQMEEMYTSWESKILHSKPQSINLTGSTTNLLMSMSLLRAETTHLPGEDLQHGRAETPVGKKPINRLIDAVSIK